MLKEAMLVALGSALGGVARVALASGIYRRWGTTFPWGTLAVNVLGCLAMGFLFAWGEHRWRAGAAARLFLMAGFCGGFTTFSTYALEAGQLFTAGAALSGATYLAVSTAGGLAAFAAGAALARVLL